MPGEFTPSSERAALAMFLDVQRDALVRKVRGVDERAARSTPTASALSLLALVKHSAIWEERWFQGVVAGGALEDGWPDAGPSGAADDFLLTDADTVEHWVARYEAAAEVSRGIAAARDLDAAAARSDILDCNLRWVLLHLIEETARHAGHADILRETVDGTRGM